MMKSHIKKRNNKPQSNLDFKMMSFCFSIRDRFKDPINKIKRTTIRVGDSVLDYGCGSGSYSIIAAEMVGPTGKVFSADIHPLAIKKVIKKASKKGLKNIDTILTDCATYLEDNSIDIIICFDTLHTLGNLRENMLEFYRVLKPDGSLSVDDHHSEENEIISKIQENGLFKLLDKQDQIYNFIKKENTKVRAG